MKNRPQFSSFEYLGLSLKYFQTAKLITDTDNFRSSSRKYLQPTLQLVSQGVELLLKSALKAHGKSEADFQGHRIAEFWEDCPDEALIREVLSTAVRIVNRYSPVQQWTPPEGAKAEFEEMIKQLSVVHTKDGSQLRYPAPNGTRAPRAGWLVETFHEVVEFAYVNHPEYIASENSDHT